MQTNDEFILVVDDDDDLRGILAAAVSRHFPQHDVIACSSGTDALREAQLAQKAGRELALAITDEVMPGLRGIDLMEALAHIFPDAARAIVTGYASVESAISGLRIGIDDFLQKPFQESELVQTCEQLLKTHALRAENRRLRNRLGIAYAEAAELVNLVFKPIDASLQELLATNPNAVDYLDSVRKSRKDMVQLAYLFQCASRVFADSDAPRENANLPELVQEAAAVLLGEDLPIHSPREVVVDGDRNAAYIIIERCIESCLTLLDEGAALSLWVHGAGGEIPDGWSGDRPPKTSFESQDHAYVVITGRAADARAAAHFLSSTLRGSNLELLPETVGLKLSQLYLQMMDGAMAYNFPDQGRFQLWLQFRGA